MTMETSSAEPKVSSSPTASGNKRSFDVAFLIDKKIKSREDQDPCKDSPPPEKRETTSAFQKVAKTQNSLPTQPSPSEFGYPFSLPAIATTLSLQLLQQTTAKNLAMSFLNPASSLLLQQNPKTYNPHLPVPSGGRDASVLEDYIRAQASAFPEKPRVSSSHDLGVPIPYPFVEPGARLTCPSSVAPVLPVAPPMMGFSAAQNVCAKCNLSFRMTSDLVYHMRSQHRKDTDPVRQKRQEKLRCPVCGEAFRERHHLTRHMTSHEDRELETK